MNEPLAQMFRYNAWANAILLDACGALGDEQLNFAIDGAYGSISKTLMHYIGSQDVYLSDLRGAARDRSHWRRGPWPGFDAISGHATESSEALVREAESLVTDSRVTFVMELDDAKTATKSALLVQALQHATEHREQICAALTHLGSHPPDLSGWAWADATGAASELPG
jgi:uncharacterized damage-inducible protein DinB